MFLDFYFFIFCPQKIEITTPKSCIQLGVFFSLQPDCPKQHRTLVQVHVVPFWTPCHQLPCRQAGCQGRPTLKWTEQHDFSMPARLPPPDGLFDPLFWGLVVALAVTPSPAQLLHPSTSPLMLFPVHSKLTRPSQRDHTWTSQFQLIADVSADQTSYPFFKFFYPTISSRISDAGTELETKTNC